MVIFENIVRADDTPDPSHDILGPLMPARDFLSIITDESGKGGFLVRKTYASPNSPHLIKTNLNPFRLLSEVEPGRYGLTSKDHSAFTTVAGHVTGDNKSLLISTSPIFSDGSPRFKGEIMSIDVHKARTPGWS